MDEEQATFTDRSRFVYLRVNVFMPGDDGGEHDIFVGERTDDESTDVAIDAEVIGLLTYIAEAMREGMRPGSVDNPQFPPGLLILPPPGFLFEEFKVITEPVAIYPAKRVSSITTELIGPTR